MRRPAFSRYVLYIYIRLSMYLHISICRYTYCIFSKRNWCKATPPTLTCMAVSMRRPAFSRYVLYISIRLSIYLHISICRYTYCIFSKRNWSKATPPTLTCLAVSMRRPAFSRYVIYINISDYLAIYMYVYVYLHIASLENVIGI